MILQHITLLTGDNATHRLDTLDAGAVQACRNLLPDGGKIPSLDAYRVTITDNRIFTIWRGKSPLVTCGLGRGLDDNWRGLISLAQQVGSPVNANAPKGNWLGVVLLPGLMAENPQNIGWLADFERCLAAAILLP